MVDDHTACLAIVIGALAVGQGVTMIAVGGMEGEIWLEVVGSVGLILGLCLLAMVFVRDRPR